jgi:predicted  nucleic acid-binding Zn-ribbon protein
VSNEWFLKLREIDSLLREKKRIETNIDEENNRLTKLSSQLSFSLDESDKTKKELFSKQNILFELEKKIKTFSSQKDNLFSVGKEFSHLIPQIDELETQGLDLLTEIEELQIKERELATFQKGLQKTIEEIQSEVTKTLIEEEKKIENILLRIELLERDLPQKISEVYKRTLTKNLAHGPFSKNEQGHCLFCRYKLSKVDESEIDIQKILKQCPQCTRIFLPYGT